MNTGTNLLSTEQVLVAEANAIHGAGAVPDSRDGKPLAGKALYRELNRCNSAALCLSGGGIRSAAFALGVIQALAVHTQSRADAPVSSAQDSLLANFHYSSTVSGGGYIGGWLSALRARTPAGFPEIWRMLADRRTRPEEEPREIAWLRRYSNYLTPKLGVMSADSWAAVAISVRNILLNWLVILPLVCAGLLILKLVAVAAAWLGKYSPNECDPIIAAVAVLLALLTVVALIVSARFTASHRPAGSRGEATQSEFLLGDLLPAVLSGVAFTLTLAIPCTHDFLLSWSGGLLIVFGAVVGMAAYGLAWALTGQQRANARERPGDFAAWIGGGLVYGACLGLGVYLHRQIYDLQSITPEVLLLIFGVPWTMTSQLMGEIIFVGLSSWEEKSDSDREWLGRAAGWFVVTVLGWIIVMFLTLAAAYAVVQAARYAIGWYAHFADDLNTALKAVGATLTGIAGVASGIATLFLGKSSHSPAQGAAKTSTGFSMNVILAITTPIFVVTLVILLSALLDEVLLGQPLLETESIRGFVSPDSVAPWPHAATPLLIALVVVAIVGVGASIVVNINRFSLHALYRNRIIRAFLGASNPHRNPDPFTDFDEGDNWPMHKLWSADRSGGWRPFHVVNMALNIVSTKNLAWQERKAESFTVSPLHSGSACKAYRSSREYGHRDRGISLGTAVAISGAAASPNMGYHSSPAVTLLMALFNVRLGWWLGNPGREGEKTYREEGPNFAIRPLLAETFGLTTDDKPYIYLSDGGHFENLGLYEMVRRRCRLIVVSDAGCDPDFKFEDLGNAVRKIKLDLGVTIRFHGIEKLKTRSKDGVDVDPRTPYHAVGEIDYPAADRESGEQTVEKGLILYIKPACHGTEEADIRSYATEHPDFPHQSTAEQWFSESQFESYRALGFEIVNGLLSGALAALQPPVTLDKIVRAISEPTVEGAPKARWTPGEVAASQAAAAERIARAGA